MASPTSITGTFNVTYGEVNRTESFGSTLNTLTSGGKNYISCDMRVTESSAGTALDPGQVGTTDVGLVAIKNLNTYGDLHVDINYVTSWFTDLIIPPGGLNVITPNVTNNTNGEGSYQSVPKCKTPQAAGAANRTIDTINSNGTLTFTSGHAPFVHDCLIVKDGGGGSDTSTYIVKLSAADTGILYELDGTTVKDITTGWNNAAHGYTTTLQLTPFVDLRYILTEE